MIFCYKITAVVGTVWPSGGHLPLPQSYDALSFFSGTKFRRPRPWNHGIFRTHEHAWGMVIGSNHDRQCAISILKPSTLVEVPKIDNVHKAEEMSLKQPIRCRIIARVRRIGTAQFWRDGPRGVLAPLPLTLSPSFIDVQGGKLQK